MPGLYNVSAYKTKNPLGSLDSLFYFTFTGHSIPIWITVQGRKWIKKYTIIHDLIKLRFKLLTGFYQTRQEMCFFNLLTFPYQKGLESFLGTLLGVIQSDIQ